MTRRLVLGLGSNLGDPEANLLWGLQQLGEHFGRLRVAPPYRTRPLSPIPQSEFLNTVAIVVGDLPAPEPSGADLLDLLVQLKTLETQAGRRPGPRLGPRPLDIDLLLYGDLQRRIPGPQNADSGVDGLILPHPRLTERRFVLAPLADLEPSWTIPGTSRTVAEHLEQLGETQHVERQTWSSEAAPNHLKRLRT